jgi:DNA-binding GntR family transcriptional regulator
MIVESLADGARRHIQEWIATGELKPGQQIKEEEIANRLNISRPPIREAFKTLEAQGLVVRKPRRGVFVTEMEEKDIWEVYTLKATLYEMAAALVVENITAQQIYELETLCKEMESCVSNTPPDILAYQKFHRAFHVRALEIADNERLKQIATNLHQQIRRFSYRTLQDKDHLHSSLGYHKKIVEAIAQRQKTTACRLMKKHVLDALAVLLDCHIAAQGETWEIPAWEPQKQDEVVAEEIAPVDDRSAGYAKN